MYCGRSVCLFARRRLLSVSPHHIFKLLELGSPILVYTTSMGYRWRSSTCLRILSKGWKGDRKKNCGCGLLRSLSACLVQLSIDMNSNPAAAFSRTFPCPSLGLSHILNSSLHVFCNLSLKLRLTAGYICRYYYYWVERWSKFNAL